MAESQNTKIDYSYIKKNAAHLWNLKDYSGLKNFALKNKDLWLQYSKADYYTSVIFAHSFLHTSDYKGALPFYEQSLKLFMKPETLFHYQTCIKNTQNYTRAVEFFKLLKTIYPKQIHEIKKIETITLFFKAVFEGDQNYSKNKASALNHYQKANAYYQEIEIDLELEKKWRQTLGKTEREEEYSLYRLYLDKNGYKRYYYENATLLKIKTALAKEHKPKQKALREINYAVFIIRNSDYTMSTKKGIVSEKNSLSDVDIEKTKQAWQMLEDIVSSISKGKTILKTDWIELNGVKVSGLKAGNYKGLFETYTLDPNLLNPIPYDVFKEAMTRYQGVAFLWPRGNYPKNYGGGKVILPSKPKNKTVLNFIGSIDSNTEILLHEFLHGFNTVTLDVHGPTRNKTFKDYSGFNGSTAIDWYIYLLEKAILINTP